ncbi:MAG: class I SAM-dependent methyltransferase [Persicimonas sp.]
MSTDARYWRDKYDRPDFVYGRHPNQFLAEHASEVIPHRGHVLSLGEGEGRNAVWLARHGWRVSAVDHAADALAKLRRHAAGAGVHVETFCEDVVDFDCGTARWDAIVILHMHLSPRPRRRTHRRAAAALRPGGFILLEALRPEQLAQPSSGPESSELLYTQTELCADFAALQIKLLREDDRYIDAGEHRGMTSVISLIGRKPA